MARTQALAWVQALARVRAPAKAMNPIRGGGGRFHPPSLTWFPAAP